jgi:hypothetical protein
MSNVLIRGLSPHLYRDIQKYADSEDLSINQVMLRLIRERMNQIYEKQEEKIQNGDVFQRIRELREKIARRNRGKRMEDSVKIIRRMRGKL